MTPSCLRFLLPFAVCAAIFLALPGSSWAQTVPIRDKSTYGLDAGDGKGDTAFFIGGWTWVTPGFKYSQDSIVGPGPNPSDSDRMGPIDGIWPYVNSIGVDVITSPWVLGSFDSVQHYKQVDTLVGDSAFFGSDTARAHLRKPWNKMVVFENKGPLQFAGWGREDQFYPFDSVQSPYDIWKFYYKSGYGSDSINNNDVAMHFKYPNGVRERVFDKHTPNGTLIDSGIVFVWKTGDTARTQQNAHEFTDFARETKGPPLYLATTGHMYNPTGGSGVSDTTVIFKVELWQEVWPGQHYLDSAWHDTTMHYRTALNSTSEIKRFSCGTSYVRKADLISDASNKQAYGERSDSMQVKWRPDGVPGPLHPAQPSDYRRDIEVKVYYMGGEQAALRSVALRDSLGQLLLGKRASDSTWRANLMNEAARYIRGPGKTAADTNLRPAIIRVYAGEEFEWSEGAGYVAEDALLRQTFHKPSPYGGIEP